ncbi:DUF6036 family nucleotidyltransferase [Chenggangzhangella methanolivorans]|uniref:DUF6036 domain-containing protein n=1 Tax=Chenggangzhangella methanolivorans TaxID=1437009 RepID=A0A9E6R711_9HYPH|nr:DUF6036 family nucleotidyltransferase [Chenggangzhangella methanolivorans]QZN99143.1 hypothetical protein K6K41_20230 [Chenggangzhangella methanolivorans]
MPIEASTIEGLFAKIGAELKKPTTLCVIGSTPGIATGQNERQTPDIDVWFAGSSFDATELNEVCRKIGVLYDPKSEEIDPEKIYIQIIRPGVVQLPKEFETEIIGRYGNLTVIMPSPELLAAAKLVRSSPTDVQDVVWWVKQRGLDLSDIELAIKQLPKASHREAAAENLVFVELTTGRDCK